MEAYIEAGISRICSSSTIRVYPPLVSAPTCSALRHPLATVSSKSSKNFSSSAAIAPLTCFVSSQLATLSILRFGRTLSPPATARRGIVDIAAKRIGTENKGSKQKIKDTKQETKNKKESLHSRVKKRDSESKNKTIEEHKDNKNGLSSKRGVGKINSQTIKSKATDRSLAPTIPKAIPPRTKQLQKSAVASSTATSDIDMNQSKPKNDSNDEIGLRASKRSKKDPEEAQWNLKLNMSSKNGDLHSAIEVYDASKQGLFNLKQHHYNVLLYICSAAASGSITRRKRKTYDKDKNSDGSGQQDKKTDTAVNGSDKSQGMQDGSEEDVEIINFSPEDVELAKNMGTEIYQHMLDAKVPPNEATFTSIARLAVAKGDGDMAFEVVKNMAASNIAPKLRSYGPVILCFAQQNQVQKAFEVDDHMLAAGVLPDETLLEALLKLSVSSGLDEKVYSLLHRLRLCLRDLSPTTVATIEKWFTSEVASSAGKAKWDNLPSEEKVKEAMEATGGGWHGLGWLGRGPWKTKRTNISRTGCCLSCGEKLCTIDLDPVETEKFAKSVAELAYQREHNSNQFRAFQTWLDKNGPYDAIIDGANIGMYNNALRGFNFNQVATVAQAVKEKSSTQKSPLIVIHSRRVSEKAGLSPKATQIVNEWNKNKCLYATPYGSNDDWYWLYAAVHYKCLLVTNDEMRDHLFQLLGNDFFPKWKERHQVRFTFSSNGLELFMPPPFTTVIQESLSGNWHIPQTGGDDFESPREWLCVTRSSTVDNQDSSTEKESDKMTYETLLNLEEAEKQINSVDLQI